MPDRREILRTPDSAFAHLPDYPFDPHYTEVDGLRIHYVDEGRGSEETIFLLHGQPSWSYLYRHMIPVFVRAGYRVIAPDLVGFGKSDKPADPLIHTYQAHVDWITAFVRNLDIHHATAFMQDWGGLIGLRVLAAEPDWLSRLVVANTVLPEATGAARLVRPLALDLAAALTRDSNIETFARTLSFRHWIAYFARAERLEIGKILQILTERELSIPEIAGYDAPFPDPSFYAGPRRMPRLVASALAENRAAWVNVLERWPHPVLTLFSDKDPFLGKSGVDEEFQKRMPGAVGQPHATIERGSHFLQEDRSEAICDHVMSWLQGIGHE